uniref:Amine oxidase n=1 Tax=Timema shepardi TaxID=629360 RepID=A0A7R9FYP5_TIMSH|nr:unnamed protein product [Timema shepardi]
MSFVKNHSSVQTEIETSSSQILGAEYNGIYEADVVVVGAGISGLTAAYLMTQKDPSLRVIVLEAKERIGGRTLTVPIKTAGDQTDQFDLGGQWVSSSQTQIIKLLTELQLVTYPQYNDGCKIGQAGNAMLYNYTCDFPNFGSIFTQYELNKFVTKVESLAQKVLLINPDRLQESKDLDMMTVETFLQKNLYTDTAREIVRTIVRNTFGMEASQLSALFFIAHVNGTQGFLNQFKTTTCGAKEFRIKGGAQQITSCLAKKIGEKCILMSDPVERICHLSDKVHLTTEKKLEFSALFVIVAIPPSEVTKITFSPPLPLEHRCVLQHFSAGTLTTFVATYERPFWRDQGYSGQVVSDGGIWTDYHSMVAPVSSTFDATTESGSPALVGFLAAKKGVQWSRKHHARRRSAVLECLSRFFSGIWALNPLDYVEKNWCDELFVGGCPVQGITPGVMHWVHTLRSPHGRVHWAGTETATQWCGYMNGAVQAGQRAAIEVMYELRPQVLTVADISGVETHQAHNHEPEPVPHVYRWTISLPLLLIGVGWIVYAIRSKYWFIGTGRIA